MLWPVFPLAIAGAMISCAAPEPTGVERTISHLESSIPRLMEAARIPGLQIALIDDGAVVWEQGFGTTEDCPGTRS